MSRFRSSSPPTLRDLIEARSSVPAPVKTGLSVAEVEAVILADLRSGPLPLNRLARQIKDRWLVQKAVNKALDRFVVRCERVDDVLLYLLVDREGRDWWLGRG